MIVGRNERARETKGPSPTWRTRDPLSLSRDDLVRHVAVFGSTGSAKTRGVLLPLLEDVLAVAANDPSRRTGALVIDAKADMSAHLKRCLQRASRPDPLQTVGDGGNLFLIPLEGFYPNGRAAVEFITRLTHPSVGASGNNEIFWFENSKRLLRQALALAWARCGREASFDSVVAAVHELATQQRTQVEKASLTDEIRRLKSQSRLPAVDADEILTAITGETNLVSRSTTATILVNVLAYLDPFLGTEIRRLLIQPGRSPYRPAQILDQGDVVLAALAPTLFGPTAKAWRNLLKDEFQVCALRRPRLKYFDGRSCRAINQDRLVVMLMDEFHTLVRWGIDSGDPSFLDRAREFSVSCIWACQGISALRAALPSHSAVDHLLNNSSTKVFMRTTCPATIEYACRLGAMGATPLQAPLFVRRNVQKSVQVTPGLLRNLGIGEAVVFFVDGRIERVQFPECGY